MAQFPYIMDSVVMFEAVFNGVYTLMYAEKLVWKKFNAMTLF